MNTKESFHLVLTQKYLLVFCGCWLISMNILWIYFLFQGPPVWAIFMLAFFILISSFMGCLAFRSSYLIKLTISENEIVYENARFWIECGWDDLTGLVTSPNELSIVLNDHIEVIFRNRIFGLLDVKNEIPLHLFIKHWNRDEDLLQNHLFLRIIENAPHLVKGQLP